jgi:hypothetical protein
MRELKEVTENAYRNRAGSCAVRGVSPAPHRVSLRSLPKADTNAQVLVPTHTNTYRWQKPSQRLIFHFIFHFISR